jgi:hypothetical protein
MLVPLLGGQARVAEEQFEAAGPAEQERSPTPMDASEPDATQYRLAALVASRFRFPACQGIAVVHQ